MASETITSFRYPAPKLSAPNEIRLLELLPGSADEIIRCRLRPYTLQKPQDRPETKYGGERREGVGKKLARFVIQKIETLNPHVETQCSYDAISYEWGAPENHVNIELNGQQFQIQENLFAFLKVLRSTSDQARLLWADAICINQKDISERDQQVRVMRAIYAQADRVLSWLGPATKQSDQAFDLCCDGMSLPNNLGDGQKHPQYEVLTPILQRSYWTRMWIVPEVILAQNLTICCGLKQTSWSTLADAVHLLDSDAKKALAFGDGQAFLLLCDYRANRTKRTFWDLLHAFHQSECSDPRDRVYALLGNKTTFRSGHPIIFDYNCSLGELFFDTLMFILPMRRYAVQFPKTSETRNFEALLRKTLGLSAAQCLTWARDLPDSDKYRYEDLHKRRYKQEIKFEDVISTPVKKSYPKHGQYNAICYKLKAAHFWTTSKLERGDFVFGFESDTCVCVVYRPVYGDGPVSDRVVRVTFVGTGLYESSGDRDDFQPFFDSFSDEQECCLFRHARHAPDGLRSYGPRTIRLSLFDVIVMTSFTRA